MKKSNTSGFADVLIGLQYGDEGKARIVDMIAKDYDIIARFNGGANAGHTIETKDGGKIALQQVPSGIFYPNKILYIGSGCVVNIEKLVLEIAKIEKLNISLKGRLKISCQASVVQPHHILVDGLIGNTVGTTKNGIGPCYADKAYRMEGERLLNVRLGDLLSDPEHFFSAIRDNYEVTRVDYDISNLDIEAAMRELKNAFEQLKDYIEEDTLFIEKKVAAGSKVLFEGAQSVMLDVTRGSVPFVTSSHTMAAAAFLGGDLCVDYHRKTIGVAKAVMSRVGHGPFASEFGGAKSEKYCMEIHEEKPKYNKATEEAYEIEKLLKSDDEFDFGVAMRILSGEYGTVTARPRRVGMLDLVQLSYAIKLNGVDELIINKCDLLNVFASSKTGKIPLVVAYSLDGKEIDYVPGSVSSYYKVKTGVEYRECFEEDISAIRNFSELPESLKSLLKEVEEKTNSKITGIGVGPERDQFVTIS